MTGCGRRAAAACLVKSLVQVEDDIALAAKSGSRGEIHDWYCQGLTGCSARIRSTDDTESWQSSPALDDLG